MTDFIIVMTYICSVFFVLGVVGAVTETIMRRTGRWM